jgi:hypothetical protein
MAAIKSTRLNYFVIAAIYMSVWGCASSRPTTLDSGIRIGHVSHYEVTDPVTGESVALFSQLSKGGEWHFYLLRGQGTQPSNYGTNPFTLQTLHFALQKMPPHKTITWISLPPDVDAPHSLVKKVTAIAKRYKVNIYVGYFIDQATFTHLE